MFVTYEGEITCKYSFTFQNSWWLIWEKIQNSRQKTLGVMITLEICSIILQKATLSHHFLETKHSVFFIFKNTHEHKCTYHLLWSAITCPHNFGLAVVIKADDNLISITRNITDSFS